MTRVLKELLYNARIWSQRLVTSLEIIHELVDQAF